MNKINVIKTVYDIKHISPLSLVQNSIYGRLLARCKNHHINIIYDDSLAYSYAYIIHLKDNSICIKTHIDEVEKILYISLFSYRERSLRYIEITNSMCDEDVNIAEHIIDTIFEVIL